MLRKIITVLGLTCITQIFAQIAGTSDYQFLNLIPSPRQAALGGKVFTNVDYDVTQGIFNPATINKKMDKQLAVNYSSYLGAVGYGSAAYASSLGKRARVFHAGLTYMNYGEFDGYDEAGNSTGAFNGVDMVFSLGHALRIDVSDFYFGTNAKFISSKYEQYGSFGFAVDLGLLYLNPESNLNTSLVIRNFGTHISSYDGLNKRLPFEIALGLSKRMEHVPIRWHITLENLQQWPISEPLPSQTVEDLSGETSLKDIGFLGQFIRHTIIGAELFPERGFNIRLGYNFRRGNDLKTIEDRNFSGFSGGIGLKRRKLRFSYTHARYTGAANSNFFGLQIDLLPGKESNLVEE